MVYEFYVIDLNTGSQILPIDEDECLIGVFPDHFTNEDVVKRLRKKFSSETGIDVAIIINDNYTIDVYFNE